MNRNELLAALSDRFEGFELVELLDIPVDEIIEVFKENIEDNFDMLEEYLTYGR